MNELSDPIITEDVVAPILPENNQPEPPGVIPISDNDFIKRMMKSGNLIDDNGRTTDMYDSWARTSPMAEQTGVVSPSAGGFFAEAGKALQKKQYELGVKIGKTFPGAFSDLRKWGEQSLEYNKQLEPSRQEGPGGWLGRETGEIVGAVELPVAVSALVAAVPEISPLLIAATMASTMAAQDYGTNQERIQQESGGKLNPYQVVGAALYATSFDSILGSVGPQMLLAGSVSKALKLRATPAGTAPTPGLLAARKMATKEGGGKYYEDIARAVYGDNLGANFMRSGPIMGAQMALSQMNYDQMMKSLTGRPTSTFSELAETAWNGTVDGWIIGGMHAGIGSFAGRKAKEEVKAMADPPTPEAMTKVYGVEAYQDHPAYLASLQKFETFKQSLPEPIRFIGDVIQNFAFNFSAKTEGKTRPERFISDPNLVFFSQIPGAKLKLLAGSMQGKSSSEMMTILRKEVPTFEKYVSNVEMELKRAEIAKQNNALEENNKKLYTPIDDTNVETYKTYIGSLLSDSLQAKMKEGKKASYTIEWGEVRDLVNKNNIPEDVIKSIIAHPEGLQDVNMGMSADGKPIVMDVRMRPDFTIELNNSTAKARAMRMATATKEEAPAVSENIKALRKDIGNETSLGESRTEVRAAQEMLRTRRLSRIGDVLSNWTEKWNDFKDKNRVTPEWQYEASRLVDILNQARQMRSALIKIPRSQEVSPEGESIRETIRTISQHFDELDAMRKKYTENPKLLEDDNVRAEVERQMQDVARKIQEAMLFADVQSRAVKMLPAKGEIASPAETDVIMGHDFGTIARSTDRAGELLISIENKILNDLKIRKETDADMRSAVGSELTKLAKHFGADIKGSRTNVHKALRILDKYELPTSTDAGILELMQAIERGRYGVAERPRTETVEPVLTPEQGISETLGAADQALKAQGQAALKVEKDSSSVFAEKVEKAKKEVRGLYDPENILMVFLKSATGETVLHEWLHYVSRQGLMPEGMKNVLMNKFGEMIDGKRVWTSNSEENMAKQFMVYIKGTPVDPGISPAFDKLKKILSKTYQMQMEKSGVLAHIESVFDKSREAYAAITKNISDLAAKWVNAGDMSKETSLGTLKQMIENTPDGIGFLLHDPRSSIELLKKFKINDDTIRTLFSKAREVQRLNKAEGKVSAEAMPAGEVPVESITPEITISPDIAEVFKGLLDPVKDGTLESIYGELLHDSIIKGKESIADNPTPADHEAMAERALTGKVSMEAVEPSVVKDKAYYWRKLHAIYGGHEGVARVIGKGTKMEDLSIKQLRDAVDNAPKRNYTQEWLARNGEAANTIDEVRMRNENLANELEARLKDEAYQLGYTKTKLTDSEGKRLTPQEQVKELATDIAAQGMAMNSLRPESGRLGQSETLMKIRNSLKRAEQSLIARTYALRDILSYLDDNNETIKSGKNSWYRSIYRRLWENNNSIANERMSLADEYTRKINDGEFMAEGDMAKRIELSDGRMMTVKDMMQLYAWSEGKNLKLSDIIFEDNTLNKNYKDIAAWLVSNELVNTKEGLENSIRILNEAVDFIKKDPQAKIKIEKELDYITKIQNEKFDEVAALYKERTGRTVNKINKRWFTSLIRDSSGAVHEADITSMFEAFDGAPQNFTTLDGLRALKHRTEGIGGRISMDTRNNFLNHASTLINYKHKVDTIATALAILENPNIQNMLAQRFGETKIPAALKELIKKEMNVTGRWKNNDTPGGSVLSAIMTNSYNALLPFNLGVGAMQTTALFPGLVEAGVSPKTVINMLSNWGSVMASGLSHPVKAWQDKSILNALKDNDAYQLVAKYAPQILTRIMNPDAENIQRRGRQSLMAKLIPGFEKLTDRGNLIMELGDMSTVLATFKTVFNNEVERLSTMHPEWKPEQVRTEAGFLANEAVSNSQNASVIAEKSLWQLGTPLEKAQIPFHGQTFVLFKQNLNRFIFPVIRELSKAKTTGEAISGLGRTMLNKDYAGRLAVAWILPALAIGAIARRRTQKDGNELLTDLITYPFMSIPWIGSMIWGSIAMGYDKGNAMTFYQDLASSAVDVVKKGTQGEMDFKSMGRMFSQVTGTPIQFNRIIETAIDKYAKRERIDLTTFRDAVGWKPRE